MHPVIQVNNLSKSFVLTHEGKEKYTTLRDSVAKKAKQFISLQKAFKTVPVTKEIFWALKDINFEINQGDRVGIIGRNGAGKSTLLKILSRITEPTIGRIKIKGRVASLLEVGTGFHPELTGRENIFLNGAILGMNRSEIKKHFDEIVDFAEVEKFLDTPVKRYSSGMYVRLAFAVAAHLEPEILIVDEVLAVGDAQFQKKCLGKMEDVSKSEGRTILFVSHNLGMVSSLCNTGIHLKNGQISDTGNISEVIAAYNTVPANAGSDLLKNYQKGKLNLTAITISQEGCHSDIVDNNKPVHIELTIQGEADQKFSAELALKSPKGNYIAFAPLGIGYGKVHNAEVGTYQISFDLQLPFLALGRYYFDVYLTEPFVKRINSYDNVISFEVASAYLEDGGWTFVDTSGPILLNMTNYQIKQLG